jgi:hypothetical protein
MLEALGTLLFNFLRGILDDVIDKAHLKQAFEDVDALKQEMADEIEKRLALTKTEQAADWEIVKNGPK